MSEDIRMNREPELPEEQEIDWAEMARKIWDERKRIIKNCCIAGVLGIIVAFSIPKEYSTTVMIAPESAEKSAGGNLSGLAAMAGIRLGSSGQDALNPDLYPDIVSSIPFLTDLFKIQVEDIKGEMKTDLYTYMDEYQRAPWWGVITSAPMKLLGLVSSLWKDKDTYEGDGGINTFRLTRDETDIALALGKRIEVSVDKKTGVTTLTVTMQDPLISASLADTVTVNLQRCITTYRTNKARQDLAYSEKLYTEAQSDYFKAQQKYANYVDANLNIVLHSVRTEQERLQNEMNLAYNLYTQTAQQLQMAKAKVQEITPVYTVVQPATVPLKPVKPNKIMVLFVFVFFAGAGTVGWILYGRDFWKDMKGNFRNGDAEAGTPVTE